MAFSVVFYPCCLPYKEMRLKQLPLYTFSTKPTITTASKLCAPCSSTGDLLFPVNSHNILVPTKLPCQIDSSSGSCTHITGYWEGPDIDDGWGIVEAFIYQAA